MCKILLDCFLMSRTYGLQTKLSYIKDLCPLFVIRSHHGGFPNISHLHLIHILQHLDTSTECILHMFLLFKNLTACTE